MNLAECLSEGIVVRHADDEIRPHTAQRDDQTSHAQIQQINVGGALHFRPVQVDHRDNHQVAGKRRHKHQQVENEFGHKFAGGQLDEGLMAARHAAARRIFREKEAKGHVGEVGGLDRAVNHRAIDGHFPLPPPFAKGVECFIKRRDSKPIVNAMIIGPIIRPLSVEGYRLRRSGVQVWKSGKKINSTHRIKAEQWFRLKLRVKNQN